MDSSTSALECCGLCDAIADDNTDILTHAGNDWNTYAYVYNLQNSMVGLQMCQTIGIYTYSQAGSDETCKPAKDTLDTSHQQLEQHQRLLFSCQGFICSFAPTYSRRELLTAFHFNHEQHIATHGFFFGPQEKTPCLVCHQ